LGIPVSIVKESPSLALIDGGNGLGSMIGQKAMKIAVDKAKVNGVGTAIVRNSSHFGSSAVHARVALEYDCIGIAMTNAGPEMAPWGGTTSVVGTNPWSIAAPTGKGFPVVLDIALTTAGKGMMRWFVREGRKMPTDWALTPDGYETDDPTKAMQGPLLGIGGHKGYGLAMMTDVLTGVIAGGAFGLSPYSDPTNQDVAHTFIALDIGWFMPVETFKARMDEFVDESKASELRPGFEKIYVPGEIEHNREQDSRMNGVEVDDQLAEQLRALASDLSIEFPA
jgi:LDH2 family malate/lactate/ureidoglycolate dehydrogenase